MAGVIRLAARIVCRGCGRKGDDARVEVTIYNPESARPAMVVRSLTVDDIACGGCGAVLDLWVERRWHGEDDKRARRAIDKKFVTVYGRPRTSS